MIRLLHVKSWEKLVGANGPARTQAEEGVNNASDGLARNLDCLLFSGFMHEANLDEGAMWPTAFALKELTAAEEARIGALVKKAVS